MYKDKSTYLIYTEVATFEGINQAALLRKAKNWASTAFVDLKEVLVSETDDQLVLNYISKAYFVKTLGMKSTVNWYLKSVIQVKDGKMKISFYDDGNVMMPPIQYASATRARIYKLSNYFKTESVNNSEISISRKMNTSGLIAIHDDIVKTSSELKKSILQSGGAQKEW